MNKTLKKILSLLISLCIFVVVFFCSINSFKVDASSEYTTITLDNGTTLTYRGSTEEVLRLTEYDYPTQELRAAWVSLFVGSMPEYSSESKWKSDYTYVLDVMQEYGLNCIIFHIRTHNNAFYPSKYNPVASWMKKCNFEEFDPLAWSIEETHSRGMEFHAWMNPYRVLDSYVYGDYPESNPASDEANIISATGGRILDPGLPNVREFLVNTCMEVVENYDVDAIHFDDYFYVKGTDDSETRAKYNTEGLSIADFRRKQVDIFIENLHNELVAYNEANNKCVQLGISPSGVWNSADGVVTYDSDGNAISNGSNTSTSFIHYDDYLYSDTVKWINEEWIDYIMPQMYWGLNLKSASFAALTQWWSKIVKYKDVNLYCGMGIYMAESGSSGWGSNQNEVEDQLLNAAMYEEIGGISLYSYNYIKSSNSVIKEGMELIKNDYYKKYIPCDVKQAYADMESIAPTNAVQNDQILSWDAVDGARGYMIYMVDKGVTIDKNNYDHLLTYTASTKIEVTDLLKDYYVATVNRANVVSDVMKIDFANANINSVISMIDTLPTEITLADEEAVSVVSEAFELLTQTEKAKVTNYTILQKAIDTIDKLNSLKSSLTTFINKLDKHIVTDRILPTMDGMQWSYKDSSDSEKYDIVSGVRLKNYLNPNYLTLNLTLTENELSHTEEVVFNIGILDETQTGLFYRNDPSAMSKDEIGEYANDTSKYIGWSNVVLELGNNVLFVASKSYFEIENPSDDVTIYWKSCATVINNMTGGEYSVVYNDIFTEFSSNDAGLIISNGVVKSAEIITDTSKNVILQNGEVLVILRFLDNLNFGDILYPVTKWIDTEVNLIDYNNLEVSDELTFLKEVNIESINSYVNLDDYSSANAEQITGFISTYTQLINNANEVAMINQYVAEFKSKVDAIKSLDDEIEDLRLEAIVKYNQYKDSIDFNSYSTETKEEVEEYFTYYLNMINQNNDVTKFDSIIYEMKEIIESLITNANLYNQYYNEVVNELGDYMGALTNDLAEIQVLNQKLSEILEDIQSDKEYLLTNKDTIIAESKNLLLSVYKELKISEIENYVEIDNYLEYEIMEIDALISSYTTSINNSTTGTEVSNYVAGFKDAVLLVKTIEQLYQESYQEIITTIEDYIEEIALKTTEKNELISLFESMKTGIETDKVTLINNKENIINDLKENLSAELDVYQELIAKKEEAIAYIIGYDANGIISDLKNLYKYKVEYAVTVEEVEQLIEEFVSEADKVGPVTKDFGCFKINFTTILEIMTLVSLIYVVRKVLIKKD